MYFQLSIYFYFLFLYLQFHISANCLQQQKKETTSRVKEICSHCPSHAHNDKPENKPVRKTVPPGVSTYLLAELSASMLMTSISVTLDNKPLS